MISVALAYLAAVVWFAHVCATAPEGYEDERGYHNGRQPE